MMKQYLKQHCRAFALLALLTAGCAEHGTGGPLPLYVTDVPGDQFPIVEITLFDVNLCYEHLCQETESLFHSDAGLTIDLVGLDGVLQYLTTSNIPDGTYNRLELVLGEMATITDGAGSPHPAYFAPMHSNPNKPNEVLCPSGLVDRCVIRFNGAIQPFSMGKFVIDFDLKNVEVDMVPCAGIADPASWCVTQVKMHPLTPSDADNGSAFKIFGEVVELFPAAFSLWSDGQNYMVDLHGGTLCQINGSEGIGIASCLSLLVVGMCVGVTTHEDPFTSSHLGGLRVVSADVSHCARML
jgi:hypothetical protein